MIANLSVKLSADIKSLQKGLRQASDTLKRTGQSMHAVGSSLSRNLTLPLVAVGGLALKTAADFETLQVQLNTLTGSAEEGAKAFKNLQEFSAGTPFQLNDLVRANNTLLGFGMTTDDAFESLKQLGDVAAATGGDLQAIAVAFGQSAAEGRLMTRDIRQLINQGVPAIQLLSDSMGVAQGDVLALAEQGEISFEILQRAIQQATEEGGKFENATLRQSQTISGLFSTLRDNVSIALSELGQEIFEAFNLSDFIKRLTNVVKDVTDIFASMSKEAKKNVLIVAGLFAAGGPIMVALGVLLTALSSISLPILGVIAAVAGIGYAFKEAYEQAGSFSGAIRLMMDKMLNHTIGVVQDMLKTMDWAGLGVFDGAIEALEGLKRNAEDTAAFQPLMNAADFLKSTFNDLLGLYNQIQSSFNADVSTQESEEGVKRLQFAYVNFGETVEETLAKVGTAIEGVNTKTDEATEKAKVMGTAMQQAFTQAATSLGQTLGEAFAGTITGGKTFFQALLDVTLDFTSQFGKLLIAAGAAALAFKSLLVNPVAAIVAGTALVAISGAVKSLLKKGPGGSGSSSGGGFSSPSSPGSPTFINANTNDRAMSTGNMEKAFANALKRAKLRADGKDLVLVLNEANYNLGR